MPKAEDDDIVMGLPPTRFAPYWSIVAGIALTALSAQSLSAQPDSVASTEVGLEYLVSLSIEELLNIKVTTPSRSEESRDLAPGAVYVFNAETIRKRGYQSLGDLLRTVPGFTILHKGLHLVVGVRGLNANENEKITLLINGRESNNVQEPDFLNGPINLQTLERVEVVVGPSSFFQRANTLAATINIITKKLDGVELSIGTGTDTPYSANGMVGKRWSPKRFVTASVTLERKDGFDAWDTNYKPTLAGFEETGQLDSSYFAVLEGQLGNTWGQLVAYESDHPELSLNSKLNPDGSRIYDATYHDQMFLLNLKHHFDINENLSLDALFDAGHKEVTRLNEHEVVGPGLEVEYAQVDYAGELAVEYRGVESHHTYAGLQASYEDNQENYAIRNGTTDTLISPSNNSHAVGIYLYDRWQVTDRFKAEGGLRIDYNSLLDDHAVDWGGRLAFAYETKREDGTWITKLLANRSVRYPSPIAALNEAWGSDKPDVPSNRFNLSPNAERPEILMTIEWQNILYWKDTRLSTNLYYQDLEDFISWFQPHTNVGDFTGYGVELEIRQGISDSFNLWANASLVDSELDVFAAGGGVTNEDNKILGSPSYTVNAGFDAGITRHLTLFGQLRYFTDQAAFKRPEKVYEEVDNQFYVDLTATYVHFLADNVDLGFSVQNLLDNRDHVSVQWQRNQYKPRGRSLFVTLRAVF